MLVSIGEALVDMLPGATSCSLAQREWNPAVGGAPANVAAAYAILGGKARLLTGLGSDEYGDLIAQTLKGKGVDLSYAVRIDAKTALAFVSIGEGGERSFTFLRNPSADMLYPGDNLTPETFRDAFALSFSSVSLGDFPMRDAHRIAIRLARAAGAKIVFDPNLRPALWDKPEDMRRAVLDFLPEADILKIADDELAFITGEKNPEKALPFLFSGRVGLFLCTRGGEGATAYTRSGVSASVPAAKVRAVDTTGAGDAFLGAFLWRLARTARDVDPAALPAPILTDCLAFACTYAGISVTRPGAIPSYPTLPETLQKTAG